METLDAPKTQTKPLVVIKKGNIYKTSNVTILQTLIKRPNPHVSLEDNPSAKRICLDFAKSIPNPHVSLEDNPSAKRICLDFAKSIKQEPDIEMNNVSTEDKTKTQVQNEKKPQKHTKKAKTILGRQAGGVCRRHDEPLPEHQAEGLLQPGDTFPSIEEFNKHITEYAKKWFFYYVRSETRLNKPHGTCVYRCKFFRKQQRCQSTGKRAQKNKSISLSCPASVHLKRTANSEEIKVTLVCHHHTHELSKEVFEKQPHGYRLPQEIKNEIKDLALLNMHPALIRKYVESKVPNLNIGKTVINTVIKLRREGITKDILSAERITEMLEKIKYINANFDISVKTRSRGKRAPKYLDTLKAKTNMKKTVIVKTASISTSKKGSESATVDDPPEVFSLSEVTGDFNMTVENNTEYEEYTYSFVEDEVTDIIDEQVNKDDDNKPLRLINPTTGNFDEPEPVATEKSDDLLLINAETGVLDVKAKEEPIDEQEETVLLLRKYKIGNISIECAERVDESGNATVTLNQIKAKGGLTESNVLNQLSKVEKSINEPIDYSMKTGKKKAGRNKKMDKDLLREATLRCHMRHDPLPEQQAEGLVQVGSTYPTIEELLSYVASQAPKWFFYYHVFDSRNTKASPKYDSNKSILYNLNCRFNKGFYKSKSKGLRKVKRKSILCPAGLNVKCLPGENVFTVTYACHHHSHELSAELFGQEAHGHRLPQELKDEIRVLAWFKLDSALIKLYLEDLTGLKMGKTVKNIVAIMKKKELKVDVPPEKMTEILDKIKDIKKRFQVRKRGPTIRKSKIESKEDDRSDSEKEEVENKSRVETRLHNIQYDQELIQSVKELQENTGCEIELNPWGGADVINDGVNLQEGLQTKYDETQENTEQTECQIKKYDETQENTEQTECQIKIDQEVYNMDDTIQYVIPSDQEGSNNIFGVEFAGVGDRIIYIQETGETVPGVHTELQYKDTVIHEEIHDDQVINEDIKVLNIVECSEDIYDNNDENNGDAFNEQNTEEYHQVAYTDQNCVPERYHQAAREYCDNENEYQCVYQYTNVEKEVYYREVGVQADLAMIELEGEYERISKLESAVVHDNKEECKYSYNSRSQPKYITEEAIINRFNIEFYISQCGVATCLENLAGCMGTTVLTLLKNVYRGEAVFKVTSGRSGNQNRRTMNVAYHPLTIAFPFEKFKYINYIQEYRSICSKYSDVAMQLENTVQSISKALEAKTHELDEFISRNHDHSQLTATYEELLKKNTLLEESLQKTQTDLSAMKQENDTLTKKITHLEQLNISSRIKDAEILQQLLTPTTPKKKGNSKVIMENMILKHKIQELSEEHIESSEGVEKLIERLRTLEGALNLVNTENVNYKSKIRKLEKLYLTDSQSLLDRIKILEAQIQAYKEASDDNFAENQNSLKLLTFAETKCRKLEKQVKQLQAIQSSQFPKFRAVGKTNSLEEAHPKKRGCSTKSRQRNN